MGVSNMVNMIQKVKAFYCEFSHKITYCNTTKLASMFSGMDFGSLARLNGVFLTKLP